MKIDFVTTPDFSRGVISVEKIISKKNNDRVKKVVSVISVPVIAKRFNSGAKTINRYI